MSRQVRGALLGLSAICAIAPALASPPLRQRASIPVLSLQQRLDLRAPAHALEASVFPAMKSSLSAFGAAHRQNFTPHESVDLPAMSADGMRSRPRIQEFVRRVHQEGLPVARLFESKTALVHLGLSPKGKPGLWLVQKIH
jgi:hypothetical protein